MSDLTAYEVLTLSQDEEFTNEVIARPLTQPGVTNGLVEEIASELSDLIHQLSKSLGSKCSDARK